MLTEYQSHMVILLANTFGHTLVVHLKIEQVIVIAPATMVVL